MTLALWIIVAVLGFIAYQLYELKTTKAKEGEEEKIREQMPHLYKKSLNVDVKRDIENFFLEYPHDREYLAMQDAMRKSVENEGDKEKKKKMEETIEKLGKVVEEAKKYMARTVATDYEMLYLLWDFYKNVYKN